ncbi:hypothetical protein BKA60DRAFT_610950 [Fusarium oxysporum]|nr:hypothetical protein BKA60DRAFT_610950 [Fusarium oxysporum]
MKYCTLCGVTFTRSLSEAWIENVRAVWIEGTSWNLTAVSGVGRWGEYDDDPCVPVPTDRQTRYDSHSGPGPTIEVGFTPSNPTVYLDPDAANKPWGYGFHESCWSIFTKNYKPNLDVLFAACLSMPTDTNTLLDWGHGYAGASSVKQQFDMPIRSSCFRSLEAIPQTFRSDPLQSDSFSRLVPELLQAIVIHLPTSDVRSLRLAYPASRFQPGHEFEHLPERLQATLTQLDGVSCQGSTLGTWFETTSDGPDQNMPEAEVSWHTASRAVASPGKSFLYGSRVLRARALYFPEPVKLRQMSVSFVDTVAGRFISGFNMIDEHDRSHALGYQHGNAMWQLAMDLPGIKGIASVQSDGKLTSWAGESAGLPRWRLKEAQGVSAVKAEFDGLLFNGGRGDKPRPKYNLPVTTVFFGESDGRYLSQLSEIVVWVFDICHVAGVEFRFTDSSYNRQLGYVGPFDENYPARRNFSDSHDSTVSFTIDGPSGEQLSSIEVQTKGTYVVGLKVFKLIPNHGTLPYDLSTMSFFWSSSSKFLGSSLQTLKTVFAPTSVATQPLSPIHDSPP